MKRPRETPSSVRVAFLLAVAWAVWLLAFVGWAWSFGELRAGDSVAAAYTAVSLMAMSAVAVGLAVAVWRPCWGAIGGGLLVTVIAVAGSGDAVDKLDHWGEVEGYGLVGIAERTTPWVPLDSLGFLPYWVLLPAGLLLLVGGIVRVLRATRLSMREHGWKRFSPEEGWKRATMAHLRAASWNVRAALLLAAAWAVWLLAFVVWAWSFSELRAGDNPAAGYMVASVVIAVLVAAGFLAAIWRPGRGEIGGGLLVTLLAAYQGGTAVNGLTHWGDVRMGDRTTSWVPLDSISSVPYWVLLAAGALLVLGGVNHVLHPVNGYVHVAELLVAVWAVWLFAFVFWAWSVPELHKPAMNDELYFGYTVMSLLAFVVVAAAIGLARRILRPGWGEIAGGLVVTLFAGTMCQTSVRELTRWGVPEDPARGSPWVPLDNLMSLPSWVLLAAGVLLVAGGVTHVLHAAHGSTPHAGAAA